MKPTTKKAELKKTENETYSTGNVFEDLALPDAAELNTKARLASVILQTVAARKWTQKMAAEVLGIQQPDVSDLKHGRLWKFSVERLLTFLTRLDHGVTVVISRQDLPEERVTLPPFAPRLIGPRSTKDKRLVLG